MKHKTILAWTILLIAAVPAMAAKAPAVEAHLVQITRPANMVYLRGPVNIQYQLTINNPSSEPLTLRRVNLRTEPGGYTLRADDALLKTVIPASGSTSVDFSAWVYSRGGFLRSSVPVDMRVQLWFDAPSGKFVKMFFENLSQI